MKIINSTDIDDAMLKRMASWVCKQLGVKVKLVREMRFTNGCGAWRYTSRRHSALVRIGLATFYPAAIAGPQGTVLRDRGDGVVYATINAIALIKRLRDFPHAKHFNSVPYPEALAVFQKFQADDMTLLGSWLRQMNRKTKPQSTVSLQQQRADKAEAALASWIKRAGVAVNKVKEYSRKVRYYEKVLADQRVAQARKSSKPGAIRKLALTEEFSGGD